MKKTLIASLAAAAVVGACGGGGDAVPVPPATSQVPPSASASVDGFVSYLKDLVASAADMLEPVDVSGVIPPTDDAGDPQKVD
jgi:hypothetical protein